MTDENLPEGVSFVALKGGELASLVKRVEWSETSLGPPARWPQALQGYVSMILDLPTPAVIFWGDDRIQIYNDGYAVIMGARHPDYLGKTFRECWPETYPVIEPWMKRVVASGESVTVERVHIPLTRHGFDEEAFFTFTLSPLRDDEGSIAGILQIVSEMTETVLAERRLGTLRALAPRHAFQGDSSPDFFGAFAKDAKDVRYAILFMPAESGARLALSESFAVDPNALEELDFAEIFRSAESAFNTNAPVEIGFTPISKPDKRRKPAAVALPIARSDADLPKGVVVLGVSPRLRFDRDYKDFFHAVAREIASSLSLEKERRAHQASEEERESLHRFFMQAPVAICVLEGPDHVFVLANDGYMALIGGARDVLNKPIREALSDIAGQGYFELLDKVYATGEPLAGRDSAVKIEYPGAPAKELYVDFTYQPRRNVRGEVDGIVVVVADVTERRHAAIALVSAMEEAQLANQAKTRFLANMSHEIRTPLGVIQGFADLALDSSVGETERSGFIATIKRNAGNLGQLLGEVLDLSKIEAGKIQIETLRFSLPALLDDVASLLRLQAVEKGIALELRSEGPGFEFIKTDPTRLRQILINLIGNAIKFTDRGRVLVELKTVAVDESARIEFSIVDTGIGVAPEQKSRLFQPFSQADSSTTRKYGGTGLGLTLSKRLAQALGGDLELASSEVGKGSVFRFHIEAGIDRSQESVMRLGLCEIAEAGSEEFARPENRLNRLSRLDGKSVLIVDDSKDNQILFSRYLKHAGAAVELANDGREALEKASASRHHVILMDIQMPFMDGYEALAELRRRGDETPILALTAHALREERERALKLGFDDYLTKPLARESLIEKVVEHARLSTLDSAEQNSLPKTTLAQSAAQRTNA